MEDASASRKDDFLGVAGTVTISFVVRGSSRRSSLVGTSLSHVSRRRRPRVWRTARESTFVIAATAVTATLTATLASDNRCSRPRRARVRSLSFFLIRCSSVLTRPLEDPERDRESGLRGYRHRPNRWYRHHDPNSDFTDRTGISGQQACSA